jgi:hypothetical protein
MYYIHETDKKQNSTFYDIVTNYFFTVIRVQPRKIWLVSAVAGQPHDATNTKRRKGGGQTPAQVFLHLALILYATPQLFSSPNLP